jgi:hypothetical protein
VSKPANHAGNIEDEELFKDYDDEDYELDDKEDISLEADDEDC